jgi:hypothetical protein
MAFRRAGESLYDGALVQAAREFATPVRRCSPVRRRDGGDEGAFGLGTRRSANTETEVGVTKAILDTSSLIALALAQRDTQTQPRDSRAFWHAHGGLDEAIEAFVLYDDLVFDGPSLKRNAERLPELLNLSRFGKLLWEDDTTLESRIYASVLQSYVPHINAPGPEFNGLWGWALNIEDWMALDVGIERHYSPGNSSVSWEHKESKLTGKALEVAQSLRNRFGNNTPKSGAECAILLRTLYYDRLQQYASANLILNPLKVGFYERLRTADRSRRNRVADRPNAINNILSVFDEKVRKSFYERKEKYLGPRDLEYEIPMLTSFILTRCKSWQDLVRVVEDVRESKSAQGFRQAVDQLLDAAENKQNEKVDEILANLDAATDAWARDIRQPRLKKKIIVTIPLIHIETDLDVPDMKINKTPGDKLLVFIHMLLSRS